jgi:tetratricopeptide (TPR) repeat protein
VCLSESLIPKVTNFFFPLDGGSFKLALLMPRLLSLLFLLCLVHPAFARDSADHWFQVRTPHFVVLTDSSEKQAMKVASQFERMRAVFHVLIPAASDSAGSPVIVLALKDKKAFQALEPEAYLAKGQLELAGYFMRAPDKNYILLRLDAQGDHPFATVYHEYTHYMMRNTSDWIPLWLSEGLAEFYQNTEIRDKDVLVGEPSADDILYLRQNRLLPLTTLLKVDQSSPYYHEEQKGSVFYAQSWALTHYIEVTDRQKNTNRMQDYSKLLIQKEDPVVAAQKAFGDLNQLQKALSNYITQATFSEFKMNQAVGVDESAFQSSVLPATDADAVRADVLVYNQRTKDAQALLDATLRDDPQNALAHETMGYLKFREGDLQGARKWYGEAVKLDSQSYLAHYYYATISMSLGGADDPDVGPSLRTSIKLNPKFAPAYDALAMYESRDPAKADEAHMLNLQAVGLEPDNLNYRLNAAAVLMNEQRSEAALGVLKAAKRVAKTPEEVASVDSRIERIEQYQAAVAQSKAVGDTVTVEARTTTTDTRTMTVTSSDGRTYVLKPHSVDEAPKYPTEPPTGARHTARGIIESVKCAYPSILTLQVDEAGKTVSLYRNDFYQIEFTVTNFTPKSDINPCTDIQGLKGKVEYAEVSDKSIAGQILSIELSK